MQNASIILEFPKIAQEVSFFAHSERGKESSLNLKRLAKDELIEELSYLKETIDLIARYGYLPIDSSADLRNVMEYASRGGVLSAHELEAVATDAKTLNNLRDYFKKVELSPLLIDYSKTLPILDEVEEKIHHVIGPDLEVLDDASTALRSIRIKRKRLEEKSLSSLSILLNKYRPYLNGSSFALKNGHYCLPVANAYKSKVSGALQDVSSSGETVFVEPAELLMIHNQIAEAEAEEKDEIARILRALSLDVASHKGEILEANEKIAKLDFLQAKAKYAEKYKANTANVSERKEIVIYGARHPLLDQSKVVANDFALYDKERIVIISAPNAGGKTVALKTLGIMVMMHEAGLAIPASVGAEISYVDNVYCDIGDGQSIEENLSTFAAHISSVAEIFSKAGSNDLILLDEIGTGTSPQEGEAIAYASVKELLKKGSFALISSHFHGLKAYALSNRNLVSASMLFDESKLRPTYKLKRGLPGESYAFEVAERYGLSKEIVDEAKTYLGENKDANAEAGSKRLLELTIEEEKLKEELIQQKEELRKEKAALEQKALSFQKREEHFQEEIKKKQQELLAKTKAELKEAISILSKPDVKLHEAIAAKKKLEEFEEEEESNFENNEEIKKDDYVLIPAYNVRGRVTKVSNNKIEVVSPDGLSFSISPKKVQKVGKPAEKKEKLARVDRMLSSSVPLELNIIGMRFDEGKRALENYLDSCRLSSNKRVRIVHGMGSGVLRRMTQNYLKEHKEFVEKFEDADQYEGGLGATIAYLK
jgi:DNA mismatch repair protein MutS2